MQHIVDAVADALNNAIHEFVNAYDETVYAVALVPSSVGYHVHCAIATEERLASCAESYKNNLDSATKQTWLRWANPDDGWFQDTHKHFEAASALLSDAIRGGELSEFDERIVEMLCEALSIVVASDAAMTDAVFSVTHGVEPQEFLYWASKINVDQKLERLQSEFAASQEAESQIEI
ncbi:uncharacterized protein (DUF2237 family) [Rhodopirellula rubra]|uniref:Uncharacterized protein (DUF2237 family) n=1 Tax=Aporhodopirellula rubra TaxID=980271 RepID=A0A7W5E5R0_9BACT|nr:DUF4303 domain-containing protein [Aporhodopirellula rubra]MBB3210761.1 uncharacterized protein (DUF2237 family) [Aporhodopirellula rubra]